MKKTILFVALIAAILFTGISCSSTRSAEEDPYAPVLRGRWYTDLPAERSHLSVGVVDMLSDDFCAALIGSFAEKGIEVTEAGKTADGEILAEEGLIFVGRTMDLKISEEGISLTVEFMLRGVPGGDPFAWFRISHTAPSMEEAIKAISDALAGEVAPAFGS